MQTFFARFPALTPALLYTVICVVLLPSFPGVIGTDDVAYASIAQRYAALDFPAAINGMWSPLNSWLAAPFITPAQDQHGIVRIFLLLNIAFGIIIFFAAQMLLMQAGITRKQIFFSLLALVPFCVQATFEELAADWLSTALLLIYFILIYSPRYKANLIFPLMCGCMGAAAYYARYYNFWAIGLHFLCCNLWYYRGSLRNPALRNAMLLRLAIGLGIMLICCVPWVFALHQRYGFWALNYTGRIDMAWSMDASTIFSKDNVLLPPTVPGATSWWEDPLALQREWLTPFSSSYYFMKQCGRTALASLSLAKCLLLLTPMSALLGFILLRNRFTIARGTSSALLLITLFTYPLGYLVFHVEMRFIWPLAVPIMILLLRHAEVQSVLKKSVMRGLIFLSFIPYPVYKLIAFVTNAKSEQVVSDALRTTNLDGTTMVSSFDQNVATRIAYMQGARVYIYASDNVDTTRIATAVEEKKIQYYLHQNGTGLLLPKALLDSAEIISWPEMTFLLYKLRW